MKLAWLMLAIGLLAGPVAAQTEAETFDKKPVPPGPMASEPQDARPGIPSYEELKALAADAPQDAQALALKREIEKLHAGVFEGRALALDGNTILVKPTLLVKPRPEIGWPPAAIRLWGVNAPEMSVWPWGPLARGTLDLVIQMDSGLLVHCMKKGGNYDQVVAQCFLGEYKPSPLKGKPILIDLASVLIRAGFAVEQRSVSNGHYRTDELSASNERRGVWKTRAPGFSEKVWDELLKRD